MDLQPLTQDDVIEWGELLSICFEQEAENMEQLLCWLQSLGHLVAYGLWDNGRLVAQYACLQRDLYYENTSISIGMSMNMAVHPDYRGQGLVKRVSRPVYEALKTYGMSAGMGFSNAQGVKVDKRSKGYGYHVVGQMHPLLAMSRNFKTSTLKISNVFPDNVRHENRLLSDRIHFYKKWEYLRQRYAQHPFRQYQYGIWKDEEQIQGIVVYKTVTLWGMKAVALLDIYGDNLGELLRRWSTTLKQEGIHFIHVLTSPNATIKQLLQCHYQVIKLPITHHPYYLTVKPLSKKCDLGLLAFDSWDLIGGDIL